MYSVVFCLQEITSYVGNMFRAAFGRASPLSVIRPRLQCFVERRHFSVKAIYASFPCTLHYYSPRQISSLYDQADKNPPPYGIVDEEVTVSKDGLVYPAVKATSSWSTLKMVWQS